MKSYIGLFIFAFFTHIVSFCCQPHASELNSNLFNKKAQLRKDDRAMRPIHGWPENFPESLSTPTATFAEMFNRLLFRSIL